MATYVIGDIQGCADELEALLAVVNFGETDRLWLLGDLINRGPRSVAVMRLLMSIQDQCVTVLGNHDLHFLAMFYGGHSPSGADTVDPLLADPQAEIYAQWLLQQKLMHVDEQLDCAMSHAGVPHIWSIERARQLAGEVERVLRGQDTDIPLQTFMQRMYGNHPNRWSEDLLGLDRIRLITNYFTRMRLIDHDGTLDFSHKGPLSEAPTGWYPWYELVSGLADQQRLFFGHWASLDGHTGLENIHALDTGCVYGRQLTAYCIETDTRHSVSGNNYAA
ncbi:MAG: symmetrical bis(5'-nucleosyl)-tetraphosphatase [Pseudomonadota bacterium]